jgi:carboxyl-terminal processing protease
MTRSARLLASVALTLASASVVTYALFSKADAEPRVLSVARAAASERSGDDADYPLDQLPIFSTAIHYVSENYVEPKRIDPKAMVVAALDMIEKTVAEVMVDGDPKTGKLTLTVGTASRPIDVSTVDSIYKVRVVMGEVVSFIQQHLVAHKGLREIEYAATNGMLSTLDPHSILLDPKMYKEMRLQTKGEFGGLGFVIAMRDGNLTVVRVLKGTPAQKAGIRAKDVITKIGEQSTINMDLQDAVDRLRGRPATRVAITVNRTGWPDAKRFDLAREVISVETVPQAKLLAGGVGYVKLSQFSANTTRDLQAAIAQQRTQNGGQLKGLVLDLRGNPGGLLEQAISVSDLFLSEGVIVKTVGDGMKLHEVKEARADRDDQTSLPLVVIVNNSSASASEIVAGALKNNNRALVIGRQTFGKGSVQVLNDFADPVKPSDQAAIKLTVAQYLTPGDVSIQEVGVTPDVLLLPGRALKDAVNFFAPPRMMGEVDLEKHFTNPADAQLSQAELEKRAQERRDRTEKAALELRYLLDEKEDHIAKALKADAKREAAARAHAETGVDELTPEQQEDEDLDANPDEVVEDYQMRFARDLLVRAQFPDRARLLEAAKGFVAERKAEEEKRLEARLGALGVDWSLASAQGTPRAFVSVSPAPGKAATAGETMPWTVTVENRGDGALRRLRAWTLVDKAPLFDRREFVFGLVKPGEKRSWTVPVKLPKGMDSRHEDVRIHFEEEDGHAPSDTSTALDVLEVPKPQFAFSAQVDDAAPGGDGDGLVQRGEEFTLRIDVRNSGSGTSGDKTYVSLKNLADEKVFIKKGRVVVGAIKAGESKTALLQLEVKKGLKPDQVPLRLMVIDEKLDEFVSERLELPVAPDGKAPAPASGGVRVTVAQAILHAGAAADAPPVAIAKKGTVLPVSARAGDLWKVEWAKGRTGWALASEVETAPAPKPGLASGAAEVWQREPPRIALAPDPAKGAPVVTTDKLRIEGSASVPAGVAGARTRLRDVFVFANDQKVFFKVVPTENAASKMEFAADVPLKAGNNVVTVYAREDEEYQARRTIFVYRRGPAEVAQQQQAPQSKAP